MLSWRMRKRQLPTRLEIDPLFTENEVCDLLSIGLRSLQRYRKSGAIAAIPWSARRYRFGKSEIERFIAAIGKQTIVRFGGDKGKSASSADLANVPATLSREEPQPKQPLKGKRKSLGMVRKGKHQVEVIVVDARPA
jgi:Helix-turn-helix domain